MANVGWAGISGFFGGDPGANLVEAIGGKEDVFGSRPDVAPFQPINLGTETGKAVGFNLENLDAISSLLNQIMPGFSEVLGQQQQTTSQIFDNAASLLHGELPADVLDQIQRSSAYQSLQGGYGGTAMGQANAARNLGIGSLEAVGQGAQLAGIGANSAQMWAKLAEEAFSPFTISTGQQAGTTAANNAGLQAQQQLQFNVNAAPDPGVAGIFNLNNQIGQQLMSFGLGSIGGIGGGAAGAAGSAQAGGYPPSGYAYTQTDRNIAQSPMAQNYFYQPTWNG